MELGIYTFGDLIPGPRAEGPLPAPDRIDQMLALAQFCDQAGRWMLLGRRRPFRKPWAVFALSSTAQMGWDADRQWYAKCCQSYLEGKAL